MGQLIHETNLVPFVLYQLVIREPQSSHRCELMDDQCYSLGEWHGWGTGPPVHGVHLCPLALLLPNPRHSTHILQCIAAEPDRSWVIMGSLDHIVTCYPRIGKLICTRIRGFFLNGVELSAEDSLAVLQKPRDLHYYFSTGICHKLHFASWGRMQCHMGCQVIWPKQQDNCTESWISYRALFCSGPYSLLEALKLRCPFSFPTLRKGSQAFIPPWQQVIGIRPCPRQRISLKLKETQRATQLRATDHQQFQLLKRKNASVPKGGPRWQTTSPTTRSVWNA